MFGGHNLPPTHSHLRFLRRHHFIFGISIAFRSHTLLNPSIQLKYYFVLDKNSQQLDNIFDIYLHLDLLFGQQNLIMKNKFWISRHWSSQRIHPPTSTFEDNIFTTSPLPSLFLCVCYNDEAGLRRSEASNKKAAALIERFSLYSRI